MHSTFATTRRHEFQAKARGIVVRTGRGHGQKYGCQQLGEPHGEGCHFRSGRLGISTGRRQEKGKRSTVIARAVDNVCEYSA